MCLTEPQISAQEGAGLAHRIRGRRDICGHALSRVSGIVEIQVRSSFPFAWTRV